LNGDGKPDLIVANTHDNTVSVLFNTTLTGALTSSFAPQQTFATGNDPQSVAVADLNGDGRPDLFAVNFSDNDVSVLLNTTALGAMNASFAPQQTFPTGTNTFSSAVAADVNGDGKPDLLIPQINNATLSVLLNTTTPGSLTASFALFQNFTTGGSPRS